MKRIILTIMIIAAVAFSCNDRLEDLNVPKKNAGSVPGEMLFTNGLREMTDLMSSTDVNSNVFRLYAQYWAQTTYPDESQYNMVGRQIPDNFFTFAYRDALKDLNEARRVTEETALELGLTDGELANRLAIIDACKAYMFAVLTDLFGAIPFSEALDESILVPKYDPGADVYDGVITMLDGAIDGFVPAEAGFSADQDPVYQGDAGQWLKFAKSVKLRLAIMIADVDATRAGAMITDALSGDGPIVSNTDNMWMHYLPATPNTNPVWEDLVQSGRADYVVSNTLVDKLNGLNDPRLPIYADPMEDGTFVGGEYGTANTYSANSHIGALIHEPNLPGLLFDASETHFLLAEASERSLAGFTPADAEEFYNDGILLSMEWWGVDEDDALDYIAQPEVAYTTAAGTWKQKIGSQQWIAYYNRGYEGWTIWRRLDFTGFNVPDGLTYEDIPQRLIFPIEEATLNPSNLDEAIELIGGSDDVQTKVFWDTF